MRALTCLKCGTEHWSTQECVAPKPDRAAAPGSGRALGAPVVVRAVVEGEKRGKGRPSAGRPWEALGMSRSLYFAKKKAGGLP